MNHWRDRHKFGIHVGALITALLMPFALYVGLITHSDSLGLGAFAAITIGMAVVAWAG